MAKSNEEVTSMIWDNRSRISVLEANQNHITNTVNQIDSKVDDINQTHIPKLKEMINRNKWTVGIIAGIGSVVGSALITELVKVFL